MVKVVEHAVGTRRRPWGGGLLLAALGLVGAANGCGGRTVWVEETPQAGESGDSGSAGTGGYGGDSGGYGGVYAGGYGGDYGGSSYGGSYYGGTGYGGSYGGSSYGGTYPTGGVYTGGYGGDFGGSSYGGTITTGGVYTGGAFPTGGVGGSIGGCGAVAGSGGASGAPGLSKACSYFCTNYPHQSCPSDFGGPAGCLNQCQSGFGLSRYCDQALFDFLMCAGSVLDRNAMCTVQDGLCYGPGCTADAINACSFEYITLIDCESNPRPDPCPPPPRPVPPNCGQGVGYGDGYCTRETFCPNANYLTECYQQYDSPYGTWLCDCYYNGAFTGSVNASGTPDACYTGALLCGFY